MKQFQFISKGRDHFKFIKHLDDFVSCFNLKLKNRKFSVNWVLIKKNDIAVQIPKKYEQCILLLCIFQR